MNTSTIKEIYVEHRTLEAIKALLDGTFALWLRPSAVDTGAIIEINSLTSDESSKISSLLQSDNNTSPLLIEGWDTDSLVKVYS